MIVSQICPPKRRIKARSRIEISFVVNRIASSSESRYIDKHSGKSSDGDGGDRGGL